MFVLGALPALLRLGLCPPAPSVGGTTSADTSKYSLGSHQAKKPPANSPHGDISILKRAANSPVQHHSLPQTHLMPLQLFFVVVFQHWQPPPQHPHCCTRAPLQSLDFHPHCCSPRNASTLPKNNSPAQPGGILGSHRTWHVAVTSITIQLALPSPFATHQPFLHQKLLPSLSQSFLPNNFLLSQSSLSFLLPPSPPQADNHHHPPFPNQPFPGIYHPWLSPSEARSPTGEAGKCLCNKYFIICRAGLAEIKAAAFFSVLVKVCNLLWTES